MKRALLLAALGACGSAGTEIAPVIDLPEAGSEADPRETVDELELSIARAGADAALVQRTFVRGEGLGLDGVPIDDDLVVHLIGRASGGEVAYGRTCRFDVVEGAAPHLWFSRTVQWAAVPAPVEPRVGGGAWTTAGQGVAVALGASEAGGAPVTAVEQFDPLTATWTPVADVSRRAGGIVLGLGDGRGVLLGGRDEVGDPHTVVEVVDPFAAADERVFVRVDPRLGLDGTAAATLASGDAIVIGGAVDAGPVDTVFSLDVGADRVLEPPRQLTARLAHARRDHTVTRLSDDVGAPLVVIGGTGTDGFPVVDAELYRPLREDFSPGFAKAMIVPRRRHAATRLPDGSVLVVGGVDVNDDPVATIELFTIDGGFVNAGTLPPDAGLVDVALTPLPDGRVLLSGGRTDVDAPPVDTSYVIRLDPLDGTVDVTGTDDLDVPLAGHAAAQLCDGTILTIGGTGAPSAERYQPPSIDRR